MDRERISKLQTMGLLSPQKIKLKLLGSNYSVRKGRSNSSAASSPSESLDMTCAQNSLTSDATNAAGGGGTKVLQKNTHCVGMFDDDAGNIKESAGGTSATCFSMQRSSRKNNGSDSLDALTCPVAAVIGAFSRPLPSKWNDAEKWIFDQQAPRLLSVWSSPAEEKPASVSHKRSAAKTLDLCPPSSRMWEKFAFAPVRALQISEAFNRQCRVDLATANKSNHVVPLKTMETDRLELPTAGQPLLGETGLKTVCMREVGTEMTPMASQEQSRVGTPVGPETPHRSCETSRMSTPRRLPTPSSPANSAADDRRTAFSEEEIFQSKTRKEIVDLGLKLGKMRIAAWARREDMSSSTPCHTPVDDVGQMKKVELVSRAEAWQEAENSKHMASFRRKEINIQVWESNQKSKIEAKLRKIEARAEKMRTRTQLKMRDKMSRTQQLAKAHLASAAEASRMVKQETGTETRTKNIRKNGRFVPSCFLCCAGCTLFKVKNLCQS